MEEGKLFSDIKFIIIQCNNSDDIRNLLIDNGAKHINYLSDDVTHVISDENNPEAEEAVDIFDKPVVTSLWVCHSLKASKLLPTAAFSPIKSIFDNVIASFSSHLSNKDVESLAATLTYYGAKLTREVHKSSHFIVSSADVKEMPSDSTNPDCRFKLVAPDWILDSVRHGQVCDEQLYDPHLLLPPPPPTPPPPPPPVPIAQPTLTDDPAGETTIKTTKSQENCTNDAIVQCPPPPQPRLDQHQQSQHPQSQIQSQPQLQLPIQAHPQAQLHQSQQPQDHHHHQQSEQQLQQQQPLIHLLNPAQNPTKQPSQPTHPAQNPVVPVTASQLPRPRMPMTLIRSTQPKFRPILPIMNTGIALQQRQQIPYNRAMAPEQQPKKVLINYAPQPRVPIQYQNNIVSDHQNQVQQRPQFTSVQQHIVGQKPTVGQMGPQSRLPQAAVYHQPSDPYQTNHIQPPGALTQQSSMSASQVQQNHMLNRFPDSHQPPTQRTYQVCVQNPSQSVSYQAGNIHRQPIYYTQQSHQMPVRPPQQGPVRQISSEGVTYDSYSQNPPEHPINLPHHFQPHPNTVPVQQHQRTVSHPQQQQPLQQPQGPPQQTQQSPQGPLTPNQSQQMQQHPQPTQPHHPPQHQLMPGQLQNHPHNLQNVNVKLRPAFVQHPQVRSPSLQARPAFQHNFTQNNQQPNQPRPSKGVEQRTSKNASTPPNPASQSQIQKPVVVAQNQPHPSMFDHVQDSTLAQIKAKVPTVAEKFDYYGHDPKDNIPKDSPLIGCRFKLVDYEEVDPKLKEKWCYAIQAAGGVVQDDETNITHLICENRSSPEYLRAIDSEVRCVTVYWINDILEQNLMSYPWKALHFPTPFDRSSRPLVGHIISTANFKGKQRKEVKEMIIKAGARFTDYFSSNNTLLICANVGGDKYELAVEYRVPIANCQLLNDILMTSNKKIDAMLSRSKYQLFSKTDLMKLTSYIDVQELMKAWKRPVILYHNNEVEKSGTRSDLSLTNMNCHGDDSGIATGGSTNSDHETATINLKNDLNGFNIQENKRVYTGKSATSDGSSVSANASINIPESILTNYRIVAQNDEKTQTSVTPSLETSNATKEDNLNSTNKESTQSCDQTTSGIPIRPVSAPKHPELHNNQVALTSEVDQPKTLKEPLTTRRSSGPIRLLFTHLDPPLIERLKTYAQKLGLSLASEPTNCTHLIVDRVSRTSKFICAMNHAEYILSYKWIVESYESDCLLDERQFIIQDRAGEEKYSFDLVHSLVNRKKRKSLLFANIIFFVTPTVLKIHKDLKEMIESAGGTLASRKAPSKMQIDQLRLEDKRLVVISNTDDLHLCSTLESYGIDIVDVEFIFSGILRQDIDFNNHRIRVVQESFAKPDMDLVFYDRSPKKQRIDNSC